ncbi:Uncharacterised protein [Vibrio cholerae]|nr:Uncharacterised protein [Vibrio cholerae]
MVYAQWAQMMLRHKFHPDLVQGGFIWRSSRWG